MESADVLIVGGGPAGSTCAWKLRRSGLDVAVLDKQSFPRDKVCAGWITPAVVDTLELDLEDYGRGRTLQSLTGLRTSLMGCPDASLTTGFCWWAMPPDWRTPGAARAFDRPSTRRCWPLAS